MYWPNYTWQPYQPYYATVPAATAVPVPVTVAPSSVMQHSIYPPLQSETQAVPPSDTQTSLPSGAYEMNGTTYFPTSVPSVPAPAPYSVPVHSAPYHHPMVQAYPYYAPPTLPASYNQPTSVRLQTSFDPFSPDSMMNSELRVIPRLEDYQMSPIQHDVLSLPPSALSALTGDLALTTNKDKPEHDFPYRPPTTQRIGHARRISVNVKKQERANSD